MGPEDGDHPDGASTRTSTVQDNPLLVNCPEDCEHPGLAKAMRIEIPETATLGAGTLIVRLDNDHPMFPTPAIEARTSLPRPSTSS
jgi:hypothetical protein